MDSSPEPSGITLPCRHLDSRTSDLQNCKVTSRLGVFKRLFACLRLCWVFAGYTRALSSGGCSLPRCMGFLLQGPLLFRRSTGSGLTGSSSHSTGVSHCDAWAWFPRGMWELPRPGVEPVSPALTGRFFTTLPPGKSCPIFF